MANREEALKFFLNEVIYSDDNSDVVGINASPFPELKIMFEEYGLDDEDEEDTSQKCYSIFVHKHAGDKNFIFPEHESNGLSINHRSEEEVYFRAWYDNGEDALRHCCKVSDEAAFCLIQRPYISKTLLTRRISPRGSP